MDLGIGLPSTIRGVPGRRIGEWAVAAEQAGFTSLGTIDRVVYGNVETIPALAAAGAVTERIGLTTAILIAPYRGNGGLLAKQLASVDVIAGPGRLTVGIAVGGREDDYTAAGADFHARGAAFDAQLAEMRAVWDQEPRGFAGPIGPEPATPSGPPLLVGGTVDAAYRRMAEYGAGWIAGGGGVDAFAQGAEQARAAWRDAGREGEPRLAALVYFSLGDDAVGQAERYLGDYYAFIGPYASQVAAGALTTPQAVVDTLTAFADAGCDELIAFPCSAGLDQVERLAEAAMP
jgi:alkanesulfonate monooxygenase SsuD/methylene tetrahydromethanopterin reductase-like flavin-dependent oxidoreductase (luciferase family)